MKRDIQEGDAGKMEEGIGRGCGGGEDGTHAGQSMMTQRTRKPCVRNARDAHAEV